ncbi:MAG: ribonuclease HII [Oscillospiraceae bacterium]|nr:ribonuclease HII [Oscillospiraceae bacterium]
MLNWDIEDKQIDLGYTIICGVDEAGKGPLAGPVYAAACILPYGYNHPDLKDSKKLSEKKREKLFEEITSNAVSYAIEYASVEEIDELNILNASMLAMRRAVEKLEPKPNLALIDGNISRGFNLDTLTIIRGDTVSPSIAAASILAKVSRDRLCYELDKLYPVYEIKRHKGYGTEVHRALLRIHGPSPIHRRTFIRFLNHD